MENNGAAGGSIATGRAAHAAADGYTLSIGQVGTHVFNGAIYKLSLQQAFGQWGSLSAIYLPSVDDVR